MERVRQVDNVAEVTFVSADEAAKDIRPWEKMLTKPSLMK